MARRAALLACALSLAACSTLGGKQTPFAVHAPAVPAFAAPSAPPVDWQLQVVLPQSSSALDSARIAVMPSPGVLEVYPAVRWRDPAPRLLRSLVVQAFDASGRITGVSGANAGLSADYALAIELHDFQAEVGADGTRAAIRLQAKLFDLRANRIVATRAFEATSPAAGNDAASAVTAFDAALAQLLPALVDWTIEAGNKAHTARSP
ncbi:MAG: membrane integrity-associated transporter subunit PqiC [Xanthomonadales bacterium]|nr:membrane integrity-associated transporter subunit PqiC [Xanthomonadales bacterium]